MNRYLFAAICFVALLFTLLADASACNRCGIFGRGCRFASHVQHHAPAHVPHVEKEIAVQDRAVQNFIFNNIAPLGDLSPRGDTSYGVSRAFEYNAPSSSLYQDNLRRLLDLGSELTVSSREIDGNLSRVLETDAKGRAFEAGMRALRVDSTEVASSRSVKVTIREDGTPDVTHFDEPQGAPRARDGAFTLGALSCLKCHNKPAGEAPKGIVIDGGPINLDQFERFKTAVDSGSMPPKANLGDSARAVEVLKLSRLVPVQ